MGLALTPFFIMIHIYRNITNRVLFTVSSERVTPITDVEIVFTNRLTKQTVTFDGTNISPYPARYDEVEIAGSLFDGYDGGFWTYVVGEESGYMYLHNASDLQNTYTGQPNTIATYGQ